MLGKEASVKSKTNGKTFFRLLCIGNKQIFPRKLAFGSRGVIQCNLSQFGQLWYPILRFLKASVIEQFLLTLVATPYVWQGMKNAHQPEIASQFDRLKHQHHRVCVYTKYINQNARKITWFTVAIGTTTETYFGLGSTQFKEGYRNQASLFVKYILYFSFYHST